MHLLSFVWQIMIRHTKKDVLAIPPPIRDSALLNMSKQETLAYDTIVSFVRYSEKGCASFPVDSIITL